MREVFKVCHQYPKYSISNYGKVRNNKSKRILKGIDRNGYLRVKLMTEDSKARMVSIHRLVATEFIDNDEGYDCIDHIDRDKKNNFVENLRWCNHQMNNRNRRPTGSIKFTGVSYTPELNRYIATITTDDNTRLSKSFSLNKYGKERALILAKSQRRLWEGIYKHYPIQAENDDEIEMSYEI